VYIAAGCGGFNAKIALQAQRKEAAGALWDGTEQRCRVDQNKIQQKLSLKFTFTIFATT